MVFSMIAMVMSRQPSRKNLMNKLPLSDDETLSDLALNHFDFFLSGLVKNRQIGKVRKKTSIMKRVPMLRINRLDS